MDVGNLLREYRAQARLTQQELADQAGLSVRALRDIESGRAGQPRGRSVQRLAEALALPDEARDELASALRGQQPKATDGRLRIELLGTLVVRRGETPVVASSSMQRNLLGLLALHPRQVVPRTEIIDILWGDRPPRTCVSLVHVYIGQLREQLEPGRGRRAASRILQAASGGYRLDLGRDQLDLVRFDELIAKSQPEQALRCWRGPILADTNPRLRQHPTAQAASRRRLTAALAAANSAIGRGDPAPAAEWLQTLLPEEPLHEGLHARLMLALAGSGQQAEALRRFTDIRTRLAEELGVEPGAELATAYLRVLRQEIDHASTFAP